MTYRSTTGPFSDPKPVQGIRLGVKVRHVRINKFEGHRVPGVPISLLLALLLFDYLLILFSRTVNHLC